MASRYRVVDEGHVGGQAQVTPEWVTIRAVFHDFLLSFSSQRGVCTQSPVLKCHGLEWRIELYPGGSSKSSEEDVFVSIYLISKSCSTTNKIKAKYRIRIPSAGTSKGSPASIFGSDSAWGYRDYAKREDVFDSSKNFLVDGNLTVEVDIQVLDKPPVWTPANTLSQDMLALLDAADPDNADVTFEVASGEGKELLYAHRPILAARCPTLASLAEGCDPDTAIPIGDVQAGVFEMLLRYVYGSEVPVGDDEDVDYRIHFPPTDVIHAANKYGCTGLKRGHLVCRRNQLCYAQRSGHGILREKCASCHGIRGI